MSAFPEPVASLPMYDHPAVRAATDALWSAIRDGLRASGIAAPEALDRRPDYASVWQEPGLVLAQTCGYPYATRLRDRVRLVATPVYRAEGCRGALYSSALILRRDDAADGMTALRGRVAAVNAEDSQSGMNALRLAVAQLAREGRFFGGIVLTGGHRASVAAVAEGRADVAAIDCVTLALLRRHEPELAARVRVLEHSRSAPGLPLVTVGSRSDAEVDAIREVLARVMAAPGLSGIREALLLDGIEVLGDSAYDEIGRMEADAARAGYPALA